MKPKVSDASIDAVDGDTTCSFKKALTVKSFFTSRGGRKTYTGEVLDLIDVL